MNYSSVKAYILEKLEGLPACLTYHGKHHTLDVLGVVERLCRAEYVSEYETTLLLTAALLHDSGFVDSPDNHEERGCALARLLLPQYGYKPQDIERICQMIMATKVPQSPKNHLESILCDADLDYLGRPDFHTIARTLYNELLAMGLLRSETEWNAMQIRFLESHRFFTRTNISEREALKKVHLEQLKQCFPGKAV